MPDQTQAAVFTARRISILGASTHRGRRAKRAANRMGMFAKDILFGMNMLTLAGFIVAGLSLTLQRMAAAGRPLTIGLMCMGTAPVFFGLYASHWSN